MISQPFLLFWVIAGTHLGLGLGSPYDNPPTGSLTKTQPGPWAGFSRAGLGSGRVLARPSYDQLLALENPSSFHHLSIITNRARTIAR
jgi:hypothetical protein